MNAGAQIALIVLIIHVIAWIFLTAFMRGASMDDDNAIGEESANPSLTETNQE